MRFVTIPFFLSLELYIIHYLSTQALSKTKQSYYLNFLKLPPPDFIKLSLNSCTFVIHFIFLRL